MGKHFQSLQPCKDLRQPSSWTPHQGRRWFAPCTLRVSSIITDGVLPGLSALQRMLCIESHKLFPFALCVMQVRVENQRSFCKLFPTLKPPSLKTKKTLNSLSCLLKMIFQKKMVHKNVVPFHFSQKKLFKGKEMGSRSDRVTDPALRLQSWWFTFPKWWALERF